MNQTHLQPFPVGSRVRVISGRYAGKTGLLVTFDVDELALLALPEFSDQRSETSDQRSETVTLQAHIHAAIALLHALGTDSGWLDSDRKSTSKTYPRYRWREDGVLRSRALAEWEVQPMRDRLRRGRLLRALLEYLQNE